MFFKRKKKPVAIDPCLVKTIFQEVSSNIPTGDYRLDITVDDRVVQLSLSDGLVVNVVDRTLPFSLLRTLEVQGADKDLLDKVCSAISKVDEYTAYPLLMDAFPDSRIDEAYYNLAVESAALLGKDFSKVQDCDRVEERTGGPLSLSPGDLQDVLEGRELAVEEFEKSLGVAGEEFSEISLFMVEPVRSSDGVDSFVIRKSREGSTFEELKKESVGLSWVEVLRSVSKLIDSGALSFDESGLDYDTYSITELKELNKKFEKGLVEVLVGMSNAGEDDVVLLELEEEHYNLTEERRPLLMRLIDESSGEERSIFERQLEASEYSYQFFNPDSTGYKIANPFDTLLGGVGE